MVGSYYFIGLLMVVTGLGTAAANEESRLLTNLLTRYDPRVRPVTSLTKNVTVKFGIGIFDVIEEHGNVFNILGFMDLEWHDDFLQWAPEEYSKITKLNIVPQYSGQTPVIWTPDITLYSGEIKSVGTAPVSTIVFNNGLVKWVPPRSFRVRCNPSFEPDQQRNMTCKLAFGSWVYNGYEMPVEDRGAGTVSPDIRVEPSDKWLLTGTTFLADRRKYPCCPEPFDRVEITLTFTENKNGTYHHRHHHQHKEH